MEFKGTKEEWEAVSNSSWSENHKENFSDKKGFLICSRSSIGEYTPHASVYGNDYKTVTANAKMMAAAPSMFECHIKDNEELMKFLTDPSLTTKMIQERIKGMIARKEKVIIKAAG